MKKYAPLKKCEAQLRTLQNQKLFKQQLRNLRIHKGNYVVNYLMQIIYYKYFQQEEVNSEKIDIS